jgi:serine/threonine-protein kinase
MAPEQLSAADRGSYRSDQYSLGVMLYQCLTGALPFTADRMYNLMVAVMTEPVEPPGRRVEGVPPGLDAVVLRAMSRNPDHRYPSMRAFGAALLPFAREEDRLGWAAELREALEREPSGEMSLPIERPLGDLPGLMTVARTARDTRPLRRRPMHVFRWAVGSAAVAAAAGGVAFSLWRAPPPSSGASGAAVRLALQPRESAPSPSDMAERGHLAERTTNDAERSEVADAATRRAEPAAPAPPEVSIAFAPPALASARRRPAEPKRSPSAGSASSQASASPAPSSAPAVPKEFVTGVNGSPILP